MRRLARLALVVGTIAAVAGFAKAHAAWVSEPPYDYTGSFRFAWSLAYAGLLLVAAYGTGLPDLPRNMRSAASWSVAAPSAAALAISVVQLVTGDALLPRFVVFGAALSLVPWYSLCVAMAAGGRARAEARDRVIVVGSAAEVVAMRDELQLHPEKPAQLVASMTPTEARSTHPQHRPLVEVAIRERATVVVVDVAAQGDDSVVSQAAALHENGLRVRSLTLFYEEWLGKLPLAELERVSLMFDIGELHRARYGRWKRLIDVVLALAGATVLVVAVPFVVAGNLVANRGPLLYRQERVGRSGGVFRIVKFRTMTSLEDEPAVAWTSEDDPRITTFGGFLRRTHLDELPQVLNILRGDLSIVGPRPEQPHYVAELQQKIPFYRLRHLVRPGVTGWAQVKYGYAGSESDALEKLQYEFFYLRRQSLLLDVRVMVRTLRAIIGLTGR